jgi:hypothetical protein
MPKEMMAMVTDLQVGEDEWWPGCDLLHCYICPPLDGWHVGPWTNYPLRGIVREFTTDIRRDPTAAYVLTCGHTII